MTKVSRRPYIDKVHPGVYKAMNGAVMAARTVYGEVGLPISLIELVNVRVSQVNGCPTCLSIHVPAARKAGVEQRVLDLLPSWREIRDAGSTGVFTVEQFAALELAEALTAVEGTTDAVAGATEVFSEEQVSALEWAVILINSYNRVSIGSGHPPGGAR